MSEQISTNLKITKNCFLLCARIELEFLNLTILVIQALVKIDERVFCKNKKTRSNSSLKNFILVFFKQPEYNIAFVVTLTLGPFSLSQVVG